MCMISDSRLVFVKRPNIRNLLSGTTIKVYCIQIDKHTIFLVLKIALRNRFIYKMSSSCIPKTLGGGVFLPYFIGFKS